MPPITSTLMPTTLLEKDLEASIGLQKYYVSVAWRNGTLIMDEPEKIGGRDLGPDPYTTLLASLAGCTLSTLRMYVDRKQWDIPEMRVTLNMYHDSDTHTVITRQLAFPGVSDSATIERLIVIAKKCPVSKILENQITIQTTI